MAEVPAMLPEPVPVAESTLERWPRMAGGLLVEPATGVVRLNRTGERPLAVAPADARLLAEQPAASVRVREVLTEAAAEAERQAQVLLELMEGRSAG